MNLVSLLVVALLAVTPGATAAPASEAPGRVLYVSAASARGNGSAGAPFATIPAAVAAAQPGDTVRVRPGVYPEQWSTVRAGRADAPIMIVGDAGAQVRGPGPSGGRQIQILHSHIILMGLDVSNADKLVWVQGATGVRVLNNSFHDAGGECVRVKYLSTRNEVAGNAISRCGRVNFDLAADSKNGEGVYVGTAPEQLSKNPTQVSDASNDNWVHHNRIATDAAECVDIKEGASGTIVEDNVCSGTRDPDSGGLDARGSGNTFRRNASTGNAGAGVRLGGDTERDGLSNVVSGNTLTDNAGVGVKVIRVPQAAICGNLVERNAEGASSVDDYDPAAPCPAAAAPGGPAPAAAPGVTAPPPAGEQDSSEDGSSEDSDNDATEEGVYEESPAEPQSEEADSEETDSEETDSEETDADDDVATLEQAVLSYSTSSDRSAGVALHGATLSGQVYVFLGVEDQSGITEVTFWVDGEEERAEQEWPFDLVGADDSEAALPLDTADLTEGAHIITAVIDHDDGYEVVQANVTVASTSATGS